ncbi:alanine/glycine:cation symporter family protein [Clostridium minihomine]|uniref:alanine/glycine:cation symporter family protein n=1 Tax=Clostridium minihomine TaxID=2045012 RepID=UPI000C77259B|nr:alanine/glycine:cation symporter family protein [Clostridium minihomine]
MNVISEFINSTLNVVNNFMYSSILLVLLLVSGIYFSVRTRLVQFRMMGEGIRLLSESNDNEKTVSGFQALMVSCASRLGVGNIVGVASAIILGGPGAIFWMWVTAALGGASAFIESTLAQVYKERMPDGSLRGGPSFYLVKIFKHRTVGVIFSISLICSFAYGFQCLQANAVADALQQNFGSSPWVVYGTAVFMSAFTAYAVFGGQKIVAKISEIIVPIMAIAFLLISIIVVILNIHNLPYVFSEVFHRAFSFESVSGGFAGTAISIGIRRGLYSNEAGMGSAPNAAATVDDSHPAKQGLVQMLAVFIDTIILCTSTALLILTPGIPYEGLDAMPLVQAATESQFGTFGIWFVSISVFFFAFATIIGNYYYTESNVFYILKRQTSLKFFRLSIVAAVFAGCVMDTSLAWNLADFTMGIMVLLNVPAILILGNKAILVLKDYEKQKKAGKNPVFHAEDVGIYDTDCWNNKTDEKKVSVESAAE